MSIISDLEGWAAKVEGEAKAYWQGLVGKAQNDKLMAQSELEAEVAKGSAELQAAWTKFKIHL